MRVAADLPYSSDCTVEHCAICERVIFTTGEEAIWVCPRCYLKEPETTS